MRFLLLLMLCLAFVLVAAEPSFVEDEYLEDAEENDGRHHLRQCQTKEDCRAGECCRPQGCRFWRRRICFKQKTENQRCKKSISIKTCHLDCADGLECVMRGKPDDFRHPRHYCKCVRPLPPTEEPGSGDIDD
ncbi:uncharacterized protein LOC111326938 [Stylophora pistillata]|uniref:uncharacterized protein LOC111326938 n=1 Tax=Stylophora pistillata TaxID=50429 RepID=UPI000C04CCA9|nr:uncharacterized protein LOC111326938 [Stylophora pistillata]